MPTVARLSIAPVKSMALHHPTVVRLERFGVAENRRFYVARPDGTLFTGSKFGPLVAVRAEYDPADERLLLSFPDGTRVEGDAASVGGAVRTSFYGRWASGRVLSGPWSEALSTYVGRPLVLVRADEPGYASDDAPVSMFSTASAEELARRSGRREALDSRRFRMLVEVGGSRPHEEDEWVGRRVRVGGALVEVVSEVARCVITTQSPETGLKDFDTLKAIRSYRGARNGKHLLFGVYADVIEPGTVRVGDPVTPRAGEKE